MLGRAQPVQAELDSADITWSLAQASDPAEQQVRVITHVCYVNKWIIIHCYSSKWIIVQRYCSKWIIMQRKGRVLNELSYKTGREEERLTWSAGAPLFLLLVFLLGLSVLVYCFCSFVLFVRLSSPARSPLCFVLFSPLLFFFSFVRISQFSSS